MNWPALRLQVFERDGGVCQICGVDCGLVGRIAMRLVERAANYPEPKVADELDLAYLRALKAVCQATWLFTDHVGWKKRGSSFWEIDHICPREAGGGDEPENLRTLCQPCHSEATSRYATRRAAGRKTLNRDQFPKRKLSGKIPSRPFRKDRKRKLRWWVK